MSHADPSFETVTATSSSNITFLHSHRHAVPLMQTSRNLGVGAPRYSVTLAGDFGRPSGGFKGQKRKQGGGRGSFSKIIIFTELSKVEINSTQYKA